MAHFYSDDDYRKGCWNISQTINTVEDLGEGPTPLSQGLEDCPSPLIWRSGSATATIALLKTTLSQTIIFHPLISTFLTLLDYQLLTAFWADVETT